jgi:hypothetical protein
MILDAEQKLSTLFTDVVYPYSPSVQGMEACFSAPLFYLSRFDKS